MVACANININRFGLPSSGNWCGHDPLNPRFFDIPESHARRPDVLQFAQNNLKRFYFAPGKWLASLNFTRVKSRKMRSEARERNAAVLQVLLHYLELASMRVGIPNADGIFLPIDMKFIAKKLGWRTDADDEEDRARLAAGRNPKDRGIKRVWRAIADLKRAGYVTVHPRFTKVLEGEQDYTGLPAVRCLLPKVFHELGIQYERLKLRRDQAAKRLRKKYREYSQKLADSKLSALLSGVGRKTPKVPPRANKTQAIGTILASERLKSENRQLTQTELWLKLNTKPPDG